MKAGNYVRVSPFPHFLSLVWENFLQSGFSKSLVPCFPLSAMYHVYHPFKTTDKIIVIYWIFRFLCMRRENKKEPKLNCTIVIPLKT
jgi:hypothetical protein